MDVKENKQLSAVFSYLKELMSLLSVQQFDLDKIKDNCIPFSDFEDIGRGITLWRSDSSHPNEIIKIEYLPLPSAPAIPQQLKDWVTIDSGSSALIFADGCDEDPKRAELRVQWQEQRDVWMKEYLCVKKIHNYYEKILSLKTALLESGYQKELVLGTMIFESVESSEGEKIKYPLFTRRLIIENRVNEKTKNSILVVCLDEESDSEVDPGPVIQCGDALDSTPIKALRDALRHLDVNPLATEDKELEETFSQLPAKLAPTCRWLTQPNTLKNNPFDDSTRYVLYKYPILLIRNKNTGLKETLDTVLGQLKTGAADIPASLVNIICERKEKKTREEEELSPEQRIAETAGEDENILMVKPANQAQLNIAREIKNNPAVVVQGPPGTGKTHTIANLLAHFLAQGKRVLVTSASPNALMVLKHKLPENLQPLCISMTGNGKELESSITSLVDNLTAKKSTELKRRITDLKKKRETVISELKDVRGKLFKARKLEKEGGEVKLVSFKGQKYSLNELAKELYNNRKFENIIPGDILTDDMPLSYDELVTLYATNGKWNCDDVVYFDETTRFVRDIPTGNDFEMKVERVRQLKSELVNSTVEIEEIFKNGRYWKVFRDKATKTELLRCPRSSVGILRELLSSKELNFLTTLVKDDRLLYALEVGKIGGVERGKLLTFIEDLEKLCVLSEKVQQNIHFTVQIPEGTDLTLLEDAVHWLKERCEGGRVSIGRINRFINSSKFDVYSAVKITGIDAETEEALSAVEDVIEFKKCIRSFQIEIEQLKSCVNLEDVDAVSNVRYAAGVSSQLRLALGYWGETCLPVLQEFAKNEIELSNSNIESSSAGDVVRYLNRCCWPVSEFLGNNDELNVLLHEIEIKQRQMEALKPQSRILQTLYQAFKKLNVDLYVKTLNEKLEKDLDLRKFYERNKLLQALCKSAPEWADAIVNSTEKTPPSQVIEAWDWKLKNKRFNALCQLDVNALSCRASRLSSYLRKLTCNLVENKAWYIVKERLDDSKELDTLKYVAALFKGLGKGTGKGKSAVSAKREIRAELPNCQLAVPIWIMPMTNALANFKTENKFDILIVDEASQADITTLPVLLTAKKAIIVGDDQQVSPISFVNESQVESLISSYLSGEVARVNLYKPEVSLYDVCRSTYHIVMLQEHFRCVPSIIGFSNQLSYDGKILPLRDESSTNLLPTMIPWQVSGERRNDGSNRVEASTIVNIIKACLRQKEYENKTFGIIPMLSMGSGQVKLINQLIASEIPADQVKRHDIRCGLSKDFQGDERDVIFLSLVDSLENGKTIMRTQGFGRSDLMKKRYNVAVSRAKDQLWVVYSFDWTKEVTPNDLRYRLLDYINAVNSKKKSNDQIEEKSESPFEESVAKLLNERGYSFIQQYPVGAYRLDFVVVSGVNKVALECDGDEFHSSEDQVLRDMQRQCILERNGWKFIRLSGSEFYRNPVKAMDRVCEDLGAMGIRPDVALPENTDLLNRIKAIITDKNSIEVHVDEPVILKQEDGDIENNIEIEEEPGFQKELFVEKDIQSVEHLMENDVEESTEIEGADAVARINQVEQKNMLQKAIVVKEQPNGDIENVRLKKTCVENRKSRVSRKKYAAARKVTSNNGVDMKATKKVDTTNLSNQLQNFFKD